MSVAKGGGGGGRRSKGLTRQISAPLPHKDQTSKLLSNRDCHGRGQSTKMDPLHPTLQAPRTFYGLSAPKGKQETHGRPTHSQSNVAKAGEGSQPTSKHGTGHSFPSTGASKGLNPSDYLQPNNNVKIKESRKMKPKLR